MADLLRRLADSATEHTEYALHGRWPDGAEDWTTCDTPESLQYRLDYWTSRGLICTPLTRTVTKSGWQPDPAPPCPVYSDGADGWHCAVEGPHEEHSNAAGDVTWRGEPA